ncbi:gamma-tubulin complex component 4 [Colletotrichum spaethianum]|uniref:Spindle pole body component n=1 Tax=Colletotrichum spaethianum TaxID=700344 RepID=A0AA37LF62_9PEZI|nr:gamma-tubulin complex component 4 [Colletotrichum spaethianum]GKT47323.1 gamma-tubulin complex component 4 [Colletotrichum spaethianum]
MLHEILLALSGHPSPLLRTDNPDPNALPTAVSPPERELLATAAHLSDLHVKLQGYTGPIAAEHPSTICRAVATAVQSVHLAAFQRKVLEVEETILRKDSSLVGAYNIVPLTAVVGEFSEWTRRMEWLWEIVQFMLKKQQGQTCRGAQLIDRLRSELQSGYVDIERTAMSLVSVAETAWLKQVSAWILYGRLPTFGGEDFFVQKADGGDQEYALIPSLLPKFVTPAIASSMLFIGRSLNHVRVKGSVESGLQGLDHLSSQLKELSALTYPLNTASFSRAITSIRLTLSRTILLKLLPLTKVVEALQVLREFFLLGRGEFAMALTQQADEKLRSRWKRSDNLAYEKREGLGTFAVKEGEVAAVLAKTWAAMGLMQGQHADEDEGLEIARELLRLSLTKSKPAVPLKLEASVSRPTTKTLATTPFRNLLLSVPVVLTMQIPSPLDMFLTPSDLQIYSTINSYLLSIRRAHIRLTELWKITSLRRHHPAPPGPPAGSTRVGRSKVVLLRERSTARSNALRSAWVTCSASLFFLSETEAYLQTEVVAGLWDGFQAWLTSSEKKDGQTTAPAGVSSKAVSKPTSEVEEEEDDDDDIWLAQSTTTKEATPKAADSNPTHDPQSLATAHRAYLRALSTRLLLTFPSYTDPLYNLLTHTDHLVALTQRLHAVWTSMDLEADAGVVDAFVDLEIEEKEVRAAIRDVEKHVKDGIRDVIAALRALETDPAAFADEEEGGEEGVLREEGEYVPRRVGGVERLLMKLDLAGWFGERKDDFGFVFSEY